ncbi:hypothetical protein IE077_003031 [Cardiosporidium cionae]|uniref:Uncharacterized protein n=1 Tax=Cardiosporidium cionae TaxID=476202 RepID=A0ABQ7JA84_9APIC|nr:hypothetical protein IE077_003031 [Cardiosporidium cionae]|eukprot:KAF8820570.1 hypothetical protein IE077_003031 [Cardiosporidium cionae]
MKLTEKLKQTECVLALFSYASFMYHSTAKGPFPLEEHIDNRAHLFCDYTIRWENLCPEIFLKQNINLGVLNNAGFGNANFDLMRVVGKTGDGGWILLGRSMYRDIHTIDTTGAITLAWWYLVSYDAIAFHGIPDTIGPLEDSFTYSFSGFKALVTRLASIDNFFFSPLKTLQRNIYQYILKPLGLPPPPVSLADSQRYPMAGNSSGFQEVRVVQSG